MSRSRRQKAVEVKFLRDVDMQLPESMRTLVSVLDAILSINRENINSVFEQIKKYNKNLKYIGNFVFYAMKIRLNQRKSLLDLFKRLQTEYKDVDADNAPFEVYKVLKSNYSDDILLDLAINIYEPGTLGRLIKNDDICRFIEYTKLSTFNPKGKLSLFKNSLSLTEANTFYTVLQLMALFGSIKCFKYALEEGNYDDTDVQIFAVAGGNEEIIRLLKEKGYSFDGCYEKAVEFHRKETCDWLLENYKNNKIELLKTVKFFNDRALLFEIQRNKIKAKDLIKSKVTKALIKKGDRETFTYINSKYKLNLGGGAKELHNAVDEGDTDLVKYLVNEVGVDINARIDASFTKEEINDENYGGKVYQRTVLTKAVSENDVEMVHFLIEECHANVDACEIRVEKETSSYGPYSLAYYDRTPLCIAVKKGNLDMVKYLTKECGADVNKVFEERTVMYDEIGAIEEKYTEIRTVIHVAVEKNKFEIFKYLVDECNIDANIKYKRIEFGRDYEIYTPLHIACEKGCVEIAKYLCEKCHVDVNERGKMHDGEVVPITAYYLAKLFKHNKIAEYLSKNYNAIDVNDSECYEEEEEKVISYIQCRIIKTL